MNSAQTTLLHPKRSTMRISFREIIGAAAISIATFCFASTGANAAWLKVIDLDSTDGATNPGYPHDESPSTIAEYLQDLLNLTAVPVLRSSQSFDNGGALSGFGNPQASDTFLLALHFGNSNGAYEQDGPFNIFFYCQSGCDSFPLPNTRWWGSYRLYSMSAESNA